jgi:hypothetical protein
LLPSNVPAFKAAKTFLLKKHRLFVEKGEDAVDEIAEVNKGLRRLEVDVAKNFPLTQGQAAEFRAGLREHVLGIAEAEKKAVDMLQESMK